MDRIQNKYAALSLEFFEIDNVCKFNYKNVIDSQFNKSQNIINCVNSKLYSC